MSLITKVRVGAEWVGDFPEEGPCQEDDISTSEERAVGFYKEMGKRGHDQVFCYGNDDAWEQDFRHPDFGGDSLNWLDNVHFCYYADHGGNWDNTFHIAFSTQKDYCLGNSRQWKLGVKMLKWFVLDCCNGILDPEDKSHIQDVWGRRTRGVHMIFAFVDGRLSHVASVGRDFGKKAAKGEVLSTAWLDAAEDAGTPIVIAFGATIEEAINRRNNETINWCDWDVTSSLKMAWVYRE